MRARVGGPGNDVMKPGQGADVAAHGGPGNDKISPGPGKNDVKQ